MSITGYLSDFSLSEIFHFIENGNKTGVLALRTLPEFPTTPPSLYYIWVEQGHIVAAANQLDRQGLLSLIEQYPWISRRVLHKLAQWCPSDQPLGLYLRNQGALRTDAVEHLFQIQVVQQFCALFQLKDAQFKFNQNIPLPMQEMTGFSLPSRTIPVLIKKLSVLQKLFLARKIRGDKSGLYTQSDPFCTQLTKSLDIAFFHSINLCLFEINYTLIDLVKIVELCYRPYNLPKSRLTTALDY